jgi:DNA-binding CsgD family transcriptional regulator
MAQQTANLWDQLTYTERRVLELLAEGYTCVNVAAIMTVKRKTVETYKANIAKKAGGGNIVMVLRRFYEFVPKREEK